MADGIRIAMISSQSRIGTTTTALGFAAWLGSVGASVAYVEKNDNGIIPYLSDAYEMDEEAGGYRLEKMWYGTQIPDAGFHFVLEDYGTGRPETDEDILLLVCGTKPYEIAHTMKLLEQYETKTAFVLCPFVDVALQDTCVEAFQTDYHEMLDRVIISESIKKCAGRFINQVFDVNGGAQCDLNDGVVGKIVFHLKQDVIHAAFFFCTA